jgi:dihydrofolate reductase
VRKKPGKDIWLCGGGELARQLLERKLVDEIGLAVIPILLGAGIPLFVKGYPQTELRLSDCKTYKSGLVSLLYERDMKQPATPPSATRKKAK